MGLIGYLRNLFVEESILVDEPVNQETIFTGRTGQAFSGEKQSGGLNYPTTFRADRNKIIERSLKVFEESTQAMSAINRLVDSTINTGLILEANPDATILNISKEKKRTVSNLIKSRFSLWSNSKKCDLSGNNTLGQIERILFTNQLAKGDYFLILSFSNDKNLINPLQLRIIDPLNVTTPNDQKQINEAKGRGNRIIDGIEIDDFNREIAIFVKYKDKKTFRWAWERIECFNKKTGRRVVIHGNKQKYGNEVRGIPALAGVAHELEKITDYSLLELMAAIANATIASVVKPSADADASNPMPQNSFIPPNLLRGDDGFEINDDSTSNIDSGYTNFGKSVLMNSGGLLVAGLRKGEELHSFDTKRPNVNFGEFVDHQSTYLSSALGIPIEVLKMLFGSNFSASRAALKLFWNSVNVWRDEFVSDTLNPVYSAWMLGDVGTGKLILSGYDIPDMRLAWENSSWIGIPTPSIDPAKEASGAAKRISEGLTTREQEQYSVGNTQGFDSTIDNLTEENLRLAKAKEPISALDRQRGAA